MTYFTIQRLHRFIKISLIFRSVNFTNLADAKKTNGLLNFYRILVLIFLVWGCNTQKKAVDVKSETQNPLFRANSALVFEMNIGNKIMPVRMSVHKNTEGNYVGIIHNAEEKIETLPFRFSGDSIFIRTPIFNSEFKGLAEYDSQHKFIKKITGYWRNYMKSGIYEIPFTAQSELSAFPDYSMENIPAGAKYYPSQLDGKWEVTFSPGTPDQYKSIGVFKSENLKVTGTFMTETGDYRYLEGKGNMTDPLQLSCFDGSHAFYFEYSPNKTGDTLKGMFYSGKHWKEPWIAVRNDKFELSNPDSLTFIKDGFSGMKFSFPNIKNEQTIFPSEKYENKVTIIQLMGTWCPNCMDETKVLTDFYNTYNEKGLEVIALCFESTSDFTKASKDVMAHKNYFNAGYEFLIAGQGNTKSAAEALPMLNHVMSFPTTIFIDKKGNVRKIYTGFYGPGTGSYYTRYIEQTSSFIEKMLAE